MGAEAPEWLFRSFVDAMRQIGATAPDADLLTEARDLLDRWSEPVRHLHNIHHLINVLAHVDELSATAHDPDLLRVAAWYHGAVLNTAVGASFKGSDPAQTAQRCAGFTSQRLVRLGVDQDVADRVGELIRDVAVHAAARDDVDAQVLSDADLATLAGSPQEYKKYRQMLRQEYAEHDDLAFLRARRRVVRHLLARPFLFQSPRGQAWEATARENLEAELAKIEESVSTLDPGDPEAGLDDDLSPDVDVVSGPSHTGLSPDEARTAAGTLIIRRRHILRKALRDLSSDAAARDRLRSALVEAGRAEQEAGSAASPDGGPSSQAANGTSAAGEDHCAPLPDLRQEPAPDSATSPDDEEDASSLETAIDSMDLPSRHSES